LFHFFNFIIWYYIPYFPLFLCIFIFLFTPASKIRMCMYDFSLHYNIADKSFEESQYQWTCCGTCVCKESEEREKCYCFLLQSMIATNDLIHHRCHSLRFEFQQRHDAINISVVNIYNIVLFLTIWNIVLKWIDWNT